MCRAGFAVILLLSLSSQPAWASTMCVVGGEAYGADSQAPFSFVLAIDPSDVVAPYLTGWQLGLQIVRDSDATGSVTFGEIGEPLGYVFGNVPAEDREFVIGVQTPDSIAVMGDIFGGVASGHVSPVVVSSGDNLLEVELVPHDACGRFNVELLLTYSDESVWFDAGFTPTVLAVRPIAGQPDSVVESVVFVPEPCGIVLFSWGALAIAICWRRVLNRGGRSTRRF